jgi:hypothetical protein
MTTTHSTTTHNLMFLLAAAPMGMACIIVSDDTDTTAVDTGNVTTGQTTEADTASTANPDTGELTGSGGSMEGSTTRGESSGADSTTGGGNAEACAAYGAAATMCMLPYADYVEANCNYQLGYFEGYPDCATSYVEFVTCLSVLSCEELMLDSPCQAELDAFLALGCPSGE